MVRNIMLACLIASFGFLLFALSRTGYGAYQNAAREKGDDEWRARNVRLADSWVKTETIESGDKSIFLVQPVGWTLYVAPELVFDPKPHTVSGMIIDNRDQTLCSIHAERYLKGNERIIEDSATIRAVFEQTEWYTKKVRKTIDALADSNPDVEMDTCHDYSTDVPYQARSMCHRRVRRADKGYIQAFAGYEITENGAMSQTCLTVTDRAWEHTRANIEASYNTVRIFPLEETS